jgi:eukaryotic-like serine/threonine-protein kinase
LASLVPGFTILEHLGRGAGSNIFRAKDLASGEVVAIKRVIRWSDEDEKYILQTEREYEVARKLNHPCLRRCLDLRRTVEGSTVRELLLVMELVTGQTLERHRPAVPFEAIDIFIKVARGLGALHAIGLLHTDLKPRNVLVGDGGLVKLIDFGQTSPIGVAKQRVQGTPDFLAPEQVLLDPLDVRTDVFGLGATMYWALTGHGLPTPMPVKGGRLWPAANGGLLRWQGPMSPAELNPAVPPHLSRIVMQACEEHVRNRPSNMDDLVRMLEEAKALCGPPTEAPPAGASASETARLARSS